MGLIMNPKNLKKLPSASHKANVIGVGLVEGVEPAAVKEDDPRDGRVRGIRVIRPVPRLSIWKVPRIGHRPCVFLRHKGQQLVFAR